MSGRNPYSQRGTRGRTPGRRSRRAVAVLLVLLLISTTLALSYAILRSQGTASQIEENATLRFSARQAAMSGIAVALKKMQESSWTGVDSTLSGSPGSKCTFQVAFTTGDPSLTSASTDYSDFPYRVTLLSTGTATDTADAHRQATYRVRAVVRLVPRKLPDEPAEWSSMTTNTVHQYNTDGTVVLAVPCRILGTVRSYGTWTFPAECNWSSTTESQYLNDLNLMRLAGLGDYRPFNNQIALPYSKQPSDLIATLNTTLGITTSNLTTAPATDWVFPNRVSTYQLYPGGKTYTAQTISQSLWSTAFQPNPLTNPLGLYYRSGEIDLYDNVTIEGTLIQGNSGHSVVLSGKNVQIKPVDLPAVYPSVQPVQIPVILARKDLQIAAGSKGSITGLVAAWRRFDVATDYQGNSSWETACHIVAQDFRIHELNEWEWLSNFWWQWLYSVYSLQQSNGYRYFPSWLKVAWGLDYAPRIVIQPDTRTINYHYPWLDASNPIYIAHPDDGGLRWEVVDWTDNPSNEPIKEFLP